MRVMLVEDDDFTRETIKSALLRSGIEVVHDAADPKSAITFAREELIDVAVVDYNLGPGPNGIDVAQALARIQPNLGFVLLTGFLNPELIQASMSALPEGSRYLLKQELQKIESLITEIELAKKLGIN
jgi:DNA-binding NarL/FixJ family response regulator